MSGVERLDAFPLRDAENETCWFYPTEDGAYLSWENQRRLELLPGVMAEQPLQTQPIPLPTPRPARALVVDGRQPLPHLRGPHLRPSPD